MTTSPPTGRAFAVTVFSRKNTRKDNATAGAIERFASFADLAHWFAGAPSRTAPAKDGECVILGATAADWSRGPRAAPEAIDVLGLDVDLFHGDWPDLLDWYREAWPGAAPAAFIHTTFSHGLPAKWAPGQTRARILIPLARPVSPAELRALAGYVLSYLADPRLELDHGASTDPERLWLTPRSGTAGHEEPPRFATIAGAELDPDAASWRVTERVELAERVERDRQARAEGRAAQLRAAPHLAPEDTGLAVDADLVSIMDASGYLHRERSAGVWRTRCPWHHEHTDGEDKPSADLRIGADGRHHWRCYHDSCKHRSARDVVAKLGADGHATAGLLVRGVGGGSPLSMDRARAKVADTVSDAINGPEGVSVAIRASVGVGKTTAAIASVLDALRPGGVLEGGGGIVWVSPTVSTAEEACLSLLDLAKSEHDAKRITAAHLMRTLDAINGCGGEHRAILTGRREGTCDALDEYREADARGPKEGSSFCLTSCPHGPANGEEPTCAYLRQRYAFRSYRQRGKPWVAITTHAGHQCGLGHGLDVGTLDPYATIVDEDPSSTTREDVTCPPDLLRRLAHAGASVDLHALDRVDWVAGQRETVRGLVDGVSELLSPIRVPTWRDALGELQPEHRAQVLGDTTWRELDAIAEASEAGWPGAYLRRGQIHAKRPRPWRTGKRTILLDATTTPDTARDLLGPEARLVDASAKYAEGTRVVALSGLSMTTSHLERPGQQANETIDAIAWRAVRRGFLLVMPSRKIVDRWHDHPSEAPGWYTEAIKRQNVTWPNAEDARGSNRWEGCPGVLSFTYTVPKAVRLAHARMLEEARGLTPEAAYREAVHALEVAPLIQAEGRVRPHNHARAILRLSATGGAAWLTASELAQPNAVHVEDARVWAFRMAGLVPDNRAGRPLDRCAALSLRLLAAAGDGGVVPHHIGKSPVFSRGSWVAGGDPGSRNRYIGGTRGYPQPPPPEAARAALLAVARRNNGWAAVLTAAGLVAVEVQTTRVGGGGECLAVGIDPATLDPDDAYAVLEAVTAAIARDDVEHPWGSISYRGAVHHLDHDELIGLLMECPEEPRSVRHLAKMAEISRSGRATTIARRCGGIGGVARLWREAHRLVAHRETGGKVTRSTDDGPPPRAAAPRPPPRARLDGATATKGERIGGEQGRQFATMHPPDRLVRGPRARAPDLGGETLYQREPLAQPRGQIPSLALGLLDGLSQRGDPFA